MDRERARERKKYNQIYINTDRYGYIDKGIGLPASLTPPPTPVTVQHAVALSPPRGARCVLPKSVSLILLTSLYKNESFI